ncbi:MAG: hypothetical protein ACRDLF_07395 [Solirubrobacteraceae bacterium]
MEAEVLPPHIGGSAIKGIDHEYGGAYVCQRQARGIARVAQELLADTGRLCGAGELRE